MTATSECCVSGVCDYHNAVNQGRPEILLDPRPMGLCHEHGVWSHDDSGDVECCICSRNPCDGVDLQMAIEHAQIDRWSGVLHGIFLARQVISEAMASRAPEPNPVCDAGVETHRAHYALVRGDIDEPPF